MRSLSRSNRISLTPPFSKSKDALPAQEHYKTRFYEECDKEFIKECEEDFNTTLIFVSAAQWFVELLLTSFSGQLFSVFASAFFIQVDSQLQPDSGDETATHLRVLIYKYWVRKRGPFSPTMDRPTLCDG